VVAAAVVAAAAAISPDSGDRTSFVLPRSRLKEIMKSVSNTGSRLYHT